MLMMSFATVVIIVEPPGEPSTSRSLPGVHCCKIPMCVCGGVLMTAHTGGSLTIVGVIELSGRLPGAIAFAGP